MTLTRPKILLSTLMVGALGVGYAGAQESPGHEVEQPSSLSVPLLLDISRLSLKNFLEDKSALEAYRRPDETIDDLEDAFTIGAIRGRYALIWDATACRLVGVVDLKRSQPDAEAFPQSGAKNQTSPYHLLAEGFHPLAGSFGAFGKPLYFGFRIVDGIPEFLYNHGALRVEERLWLEGDGYILKHRFTVKDSENAILLRFPESWKALITGASAGTWNGQTLSVPVEDAAEVVLTYNLLPKSEREEAD